MSIGSDLYTNVTSRLVEIISGDERLSRDLPSPVRVEQGPFREIAGPDCLVFAYRAQIGASWWMGAQGVDVDATWHLETVVRALGDPEELERRCSILTANLLAIMSDHKNEGGYWVVTTWGPSIAFSVRGRGGEHVFEMERIPVGMRLYGVDL